MRRKDKRSYKSEVGVRNEAESATTSSRSVDAFENSELGVSNVSRVFSTNQSQNGPQIIIRSARCAFGHGWSATGIGGSSSGAYDTSVVDPSTPIYPITSIAEAFELDYYPALQALLASGLGSRYTPTSHEIVRYFAMVTKALEAAMTVVAANHIAYKMDWTQIPPHTSSVPRSAYIMAEELDASDVGLSDRWRSLLDRVSSHILPPIMASKIMINGMPRILSPFGNQIVFQTYYPGCFWSGTGADEIETAITDYLDYIDTYLFNTANVLRSFTPWRIGQILMSTLPWNPSLSSANFNSGFEGYPIFGTTGTPGNTKTITFGESAANGDQAIFYHLGARPTLGEIVNTVMYEVYDVDNRYRLASNWWKGEGYLLDDDGVTIVAYTTNESDSDVAIRYANYIPNRYRIDEPFIGGDAGPTQGRGMAPYIASVVSTDMIIRVNQQYLLWSMGLANLKTIASLAGGASLRTIRDALREQWAPSF